MSHTYIVPEPLFEKAQRLAEQSSQPVDDIISEHLEDALNNSFADLSNDERAEFKAFTFLSDDTLFTLMREEMPRLKQTHLSDLMNKNSDGTITEREYHALEVMVEEGERLTLRKAEAMRVLLDRGYKLSLDDMKSVHE